MKVKGTEEVVAKVNEKAEEKRKKLRELAQTIE